MINYNNVVRKIIDISYYKKLSHIGSNINAAGILVDIYNNITEDEPVILSCGHAGLALYAVLEEKYGTSASEMLEKYGIHPEKDLPHRIWCSTGSLGLGLPVAIGYALANREINTHCIISDGECAEGSIWESLNNIVEQKITNLKVYVAANGFSAYKEINHESLYNRLKSFYNGINFYYTVGCPLLEKIGVFGLSQHYYVLTSEDYEILSKEFQ